MEAARNDLTPTLTNNGWFSTSLIGTLLSFHLLGCSIAQDSGEEINTRLAMTIIGYAVLLCLSMRCDQVHLEAHALAKECGTN